MNRVHNAKRLTRPVEEKAAPAAQIDSARDHVFWATGIVDCCVYALESKLLPKNGRPDVQSALEGAHVLLEKAASQLADVLDDKTRGGAASE
jgi:hypothetical protein